MRIEHNGIVPAPPWVAAGNSAGPPASNPVDRTGAMAMKMRILITA
jgi:hypothetical protein